MAECDGIFHRQAGARAHREMRGVCGIANQYTVSMKPALASDAVEAQPFMAARMTQIAKQGLALQMGGK